MSTSCSKARNLGGAPAEGLRLFARSRRAPARPWRLLEILCGCQKCRRPCQPVAAAPAAARRSCAGALTLGPVSLPLAEKRQAEAARIRDK